MHEKRHQQDRRYNPDRAAADGGDGLDRLCRWHGQRCTVPDRHYKPSGAREDGEVKHHHADQCACGFLH